MNIPLKISIIFILYKKRKGSNPSRINEESTNKGRREEERSETWNIVSQANKLIFY